MGQPNICVYEREIEILGPMSPWSVHKARVYINSILNKTG